MTPFDKIKNTVAKDHGYDDWEDLLSFAMRVDRFQYYLDEVCKKVAFYQREACSINYIDQVKDILNTPLITD